MTPTTRPHSRREASAETGLQVKAEAGSVTTRTKRRKVTETDTQPVTPKRDKLTETDEPNATDTTSKRDESTDTKPVTDPRPNLESSNVIATIGHSSRPLAEFLHLLTSNHIEVLVDVRKLPGSNKYPWFNADALRDSLLPLGIRLTRIESVTGRRPVSKTVPFEVNAWWTNRSFHNYADHALSEEFREGLDELERMEGKAAIMCAEAVWWRCHRRIIADYLLARGRQVVNIIDGEGKAASISSGAVVEGGNVVYPAGKTKGKAAAKAKATRKRRASFLDD